MKKIIFLAAVLLVIFSGVASVSAYEGHVIDVKAHVENAIWVNGEALVNGAVEANVDWGTVFPQMSVERDVVFGLSNSFKGQQKYSTVKYKLYWEAKPAPAGAPAYKAIWPYIALQLNGSPISNPSPGTYPLLITSGTLNMPTNTNGDIHFSFQAPVFDLWYNAATDPVSSPPIISYNSGSGYSIVNETVICSQYSPYTFTVPVPNVDMGNNLKIQVYTIYGD